MFLEIHVKTKSLLHKTQAFKGDSTDSESWSWACQGARARRWSPRLLKVYLGPCEPARVRKQILLWSWSQFQSHKKEQKAPKAKAHGTFLQIRVLEHIAGPEITLYLVRVPRSASVPLRGLRDGG